MSRFPRFDASPVATRGVPQRWQHATALILGLFLVGLHAPARAQIDCSDPDNLCTGDPCVIPGLLVASPCVVDFGARTVVVAGNLQVPADGILDLTAAAVDVQGVISNLLDPLDPGPTVRLTATGDIDVSGTVRLGRNVGGFIVLEAGGAIDVNGPIRISNGHGEIGLTAAGGDIRVTEPINISAGPGGGIIELDASGNIDVMAPIRTRRGDQISLVAGGTITIERPVRVIRPFSSFFIEPKLTLDAGGDIVLLGTLGAQDSELTVNAAGSLLAAGRMRASGSDVSLTAASVDVDQTIDTRNVDGGDVTVTSTIGAVNLRGAILTAGRFMSPLSTAAGGDVTVAAEGNLTVDDRILTNAQTAPGSITLSSATGTVTVNDSLVAHGGPPSGPGTLPADIRIEGPAVQVGTEAIVDVGTSTDDGAGSIRLSATGGHLTLEGRFLATSPAAAGGIIEGAASGDLTATGVFKAAGTPDGCIALTAGGTLDNGSGSFDVPVVSDCPGSPSGAFLDAAGSLID